MIKLASDTPLGEVGLKLTKLYLILILGGIPTAAYLGAIELSPISLNELGDFLAGAFGPLAIFWLILGFFQQGEELKNSVATLKLQADELRNSVEQQRELVEVTRQTLEHDSRLLELQLQQRKSDKRPIFQFDLSFKMSYQRHNSIYNFYIKNAGAAASNVEISVSQDKLNLFSVEIQALSPGETLQRTPSIDLDRVSDSPFYLQARYIDGDGDQFTDQYEINPPKDFRENPNGQYKVLKIENYKDA